MKPAKLKKTRRQKSRQSGQTVTLVLLCLGLFLLGAVGLSVDISNWWLHKQVAQGAADAACTAGVMDMLANTQGQSVGAFPGGSPPGSFTCASNTGTAVCQYAALNGYNGSGLVANQASNEVAVSFPGSVPGLSACGAGSPPPCVPTGLASPFIEVVVKDRVPTTFTGLLSGKRTTDVAGSAVCGILQSTSPVPIIVMYPTCQHSFQISGSSTVSIVGGPNRSVQVNSGNITCAAAGSGSAGQCGSGSIGTCGGGGTCIDLSHGGPDFSGSDFGVFGNPKGPSATFNPGTTGSWTTGPPISDPYALLSAPILGSLLPSPTDVAPQQVAYGVDGCPLNDPPRTCAKYLPGIYTHPIVVSNKVAIFVPGVYYMKPTTPDTANPGQPGQGCLATNNVTGQAKYALSVRSNGIVRPASNNAAGSDNNNGVFFYLSGTGAGNYSSVYFDSNSGHFSKPVDAYQTSNATCPGGTAPPTDLHLPATVNGNVLLGQCTSKGTYIGPGSTDTSGTIRGLIFFQDRANADLHGQPSMQGGGGLILAGNMYFHNCKPDGTGTNCLAPNSGYQSFLQLQGDPSNGTYVLGNITTDELVIGGNGDISMALNPNAVYNIYKASLLR